MLAENSSARVAFTKSDLSITDLDHAAWSTAEEITIDRYWSGEIAPAERRFVSQLLWSDAALYVRFAARQREPLVVAEHPDVERQQLGLWDRDVCEIFIAPEPKTPNKYFEFEVAPTGEWVDLAIEILHDKPVTGQNYSSGMTSAARIDDGQVLMAIRVEWTALGKAPKPGDEWRGNLFRCVGKHPNRGYLAWQPTMTEQPNFHVPERFGILTFY